MITLGFKGLSKRLKQSALMIGFRGELQTVGPATEKNSTAALQ